MTLDEIDLMAKRDAHKYETAKRLRAVLDSAYGECDDGVDVDDWEADVLDIVNRSVD